MKLLLPPLVAYGVPMRMYSTKGYKLKIAEFGGSTAGCHGDDA